ncbi:hypothetical protein GGS26DRAFT_66878 [Hypomontagnella submonticulosa]|nr:hypothetical protein GGS26DRAFT_66878 [Hypomontagnella submonticulosa]
MPSSQSDSRPRSLRHADGGVPYRKRYSLQIEVLDDEENEREQGRRTDDMRGRSSQPSPATQSHHPIRRESAQEGGRRPRGGSVSSTAAVVGSTNPSSTLLHLPLSEPPRVCGTRSRGSGHSSYLDEEYVTADEGQLPQDIQRPASSGGRIRNIGNRRSWSIRRASIHQEYVNGLMDVAYSNGFFHGQELAATRLSLRHSTNVYPNAPPPRPPPPPAPPSSASSGRDRGRDQPRQHSPPPQSRHWCNIRSWLFGWNSSPPPQPPRSRASSRSSRHRR